MTVIDRLRERTARRDAADGLLADPPPLPPLLQGRRRRWMTQLLALGALRAVLAGLSAWALIRMGGAPEAMSATLLAALAVLVLAATATGMLTLHERVIAERLGQDYIHDLRMELLGTALSPGGSTSLGVTVARTTNDLASVRSWVAQGIAPLAVAIPLIGGSLGVLAVIDVRLAVALAAPILLLGGLMLAWSRRALVATRQLRRRRGRLAGRIAETVTAADQILAAGGSHRELRTLKEASGSVVRQAVDRAAAVGAIRGAGVVAASLSTLTVAATGTILALPSATTVAAMAVAGLAAAPVLELGRILEHRQMHRAARMVLGPELKSARDRREAAAAHRELSAAVPAPLERCTTDAADAETWEAGEAEILLHLGLPGLRTGEAPLQARAGDRLHLRDVEGGEARALLRRLLDLAPSPDPRPDAVWINGENLRAVPVRRRRELVGYAAAGTVFERGALARALHYRRPDLGGALDSPTLEAVGLDVHRLPRGASTPLRRGGEPLDREGRARLALARAIYAAPPLLIIDGIEGDLDEDGRERLTRILRQHRGVVLLVGTNALAREVGAREVIVSGEPGHGRTEATTDADGE